MKALTVLFGGRLKNEAFINSLSGKDKEKSNAFFMSINAAKSFEHSEKTIILGIDGINYPSLSPEIDLITREIWTKKSLLEELSKLSKGEYHIYFAWADCPLLDPCLAKKLFERHLRFSAEYSYADGWPYGLAPEILSPGTAGILANIAGEDNDPVERDSLFAVLQKDINSFDIETEISPVDLRPWRISLSADSPLNLFLMERLINAGLKTHEDAEKLVTEKQELLRSLPAFFNIQVSSACPQSCSICPWPNHGEDIKSKYDFMPKSDFAVLLDKIEAFAGEGIISTSLWGEIALHPEKMELIKMVLERPAFSLIIETAGIGWIRSDLEELSGLAAKAPARLSHSCPSPLSWIVSLDAHSPEIYNEIRGNGFAEANSCAKSLLSLFPGNAYVQAVRLTGNEDDIENFYRSWKSEVPGDGKHIIIQKYDDFAGALEKRQASDLSPVKRKPCWHIKRDINILLNGDVPCCREELDALKGRGRIWGNVFKEELSVIWERGSPLYNEHCQSQYNGICKDCDEYYTFNF